MVWTKLSKLQREHIYQTRSEVQLAIQLFCVPPDISLPNITLDPRHKLTWNPKTKCVDTLLFGSRHNVQLSLEVSTFRVNVLVEEIIFDSIGLYGKSVGSVCEWVTDKFLKLGVDSGFLEERVDAILSELEFTADERFEFYRPEDFQELARYFQNAYFILNKIKASLDLKKLSFFVSARDLSLAGDYTFAAEKPLMVGFCPGDGEFPEPYFFVKMTPVSDAAESPFVPVGKWHDGEWKGLCLTATELIKEQAYLEEHIVFDFLKGAVEIAAKV